MARIKTDIMVWRKAFLSKCKLQKWNFVAKPPHGGCDAYNLTQNVTFVKKISPGVVMTPGCFDYGI